MAKVRFKLVNMQKGSYPSLEGDESSDSFYILKKGSVLVSTDSLPQRLKQDEILGPGDFFAIISCMSGRPRIHSVQVLEDSQAIQVHKDQFKDLIEQNTPIGMKIIRSFSRKLRTYDSVFAKLSFMLDHDSDAAHLYKIGEYFFSKKMFAHHAAYAYSRFLELKPDHPDAEDARQKLETIRKNYAWESRPEKKDMYLSYEDNRIVFLENEIGDNLYIIQSGEIKITKILNGQEVLLGVLKQGDIFGEMAILENKPRNANAITNGPVTLIPVSKQNFDSLVRQHPELAARIISILSDRIWFIHKQISTILISDPVTRLYDSLYMHLLKDRIDIEKDQPYTFNLTWDDLLKFTGLQGEAGRMVLETTLQRSSDFKTVDRKIYCKNIKSIAQRMNLIQKKVEMKRAEDIYIM